MAVLSAHPCRRLSLLAAIASLGTSARSGAQEQSQIDAQDLAKQTQNPVSDLVALPFQFNFNNGGGLEDRT